jgi:hypothetical protein
MDPLPKVLDQDAIDDGSFEEGWAVHSLDNGKWLTQAGSH